MAIAQEPSSQPSQLDQWMQGPDRGLRGWEVHFLPPVLTFQLRYAIQLRASANASQAKIIGHQLDVFVRVGDEAGHWFPEKRDSTVRQVPRGRDVAVAVAEDFLAKPGTYRIVLVVYDTSSGQHGVWHKTVHVPDDPTLPDYPRAPAVQFVDSTEPFPQNPLPVIAAVKRDRPLLVDVVLNLTERRELQLGEDPALSRTRRFMILEGNRPHFNTVGPPAWQLGRSRQDSATEAVLSIGAVLDALKLNGCVRISAIDAARAKVMLNRQPALDVASLLATLRHNRDLHEVDVHTLALRPKAASFVRNFLEEVLSAAGACKPDGYLVERAVVVVSDSLVFPQNAQVTPVTVPPWEMPRVRFYFFRLAIPEFAGTTTVGFDDQGVSGYKPLNLDPDDQVGRLLHDVNVKHFNLAEPKDFEKALPRLLEDLVH